MNEDKLHGYTAEEWMFALLEILDGNSYWHDVQNHTGLREERCRELEKMYNEATKDGWPKRETGTKTY